MGRACLYSKGIVVCHWSLVLTLNMTKYLFKLLKNIFFCIFWLTGGERAWRDECKTGLLVTQILLHLLAFYSDPSSFSRTKGVVDFMEKIYTIWCSMKPMIAVRLILKKCGTLTHINDDQCDLQSILKDIRIMTLMTVYHRIVAIYA